MLDARTTVYRALGVPDILQPQNKVEAAAVRVLDAAGIDVSMEMDHWHERQKDQMDDAKAVVEGAIALLEDGKLDPLLGRYWHRGWFSDEDEAVKTSRTRLANIAGDLHTNEDAEALSDVMISALRAYVDAHPFDGEIQSP